MTLHDAITEFLEYCEIEKGHSQMTIRDYDHYLRRFEQFAGNIRPEQIDLELVRKYRLALNRLTDPKGKPLKKITQNYHVIALRAFLKYLIKKDIRTLSPEKIELADTETREITFLDADEVDRLIRAVEVSQIQGKRDRAILETLFSTGLRISELVGLNRDKVNLDRSEFAVIGKGGKQRLVFLSERARESIKSYLDARQDLDPALFIRHQKNQQSSINNHQGSSDQRRGSARLGARQIQRLIKFYAKKAGILKKATPHVLRHCLHAATRISMPRKIVSAEELFERENTRVKTMVWERGFQAVRPVINKTKHNTSELVRIRAGGYELICTPQHRLFTITDNGITEIAISRLRPGMYVAGVKKISQQSKRFYPPDLWRVLGYICGDGLVSLRRHGVLISDKNRTTLEYYRELIRKLFGKEAFLVRAKHSRSFTLICYHMPLVHLLQNLGMDRLSGQRRIPPQLFASSKRDIAHFLAGFYDAEGNSGGQPRFFCANKELLKDIQMLLLRLGVDAHLYERNRRVRLPQGKIIRHRVYWLHILHRPDQERLRTLVPTKKRFAVTSSFVGEKIPVGPILAALRERGLQEGKHLYSRRKDQQTLQDVNRYTSGKIIPTQEIVMRFYTRFRRMGLKDPRLNLLRRLASNNHLLKWLRVRSIERYLTNEEVYDFAVLGTENLITDGLISHNSFATDLLMGGADLRAVQQLLGHASVTTTQIYTHITDQHLREVHERYHGKRRRGG